MANPLVNELIIGTDRKDRWNATDPSEEAQFLDFYLNSRLATAINLRFGTNIPDHQPDGPRQRAAQVSIAASDRNVRAERLLRTAPPQSRGCADRRLRNRSGLTILAGDTAGWPNGRRPNDDVTDIALRVVAGKLIGTPEGNLALGDGVNFNIGAESSNLTANGIYTVFPYLPTPHDGRDRRHIDCDEPLANPCN